MWDNEVIIHEEIMQIIVDEGVNIVFTSAGNPNTWTSWLKEHGITVVHVVSSVKFAQKAGMHPIFVKTGYGLGEYAYQKQSWDIQPDYIANNLLDAAKYIRDFAAL